MLSVYRRHRAGCLYEDDRVSKKCRCPLWATGTLEGNPYRASLKTRNFARAEQLRNDLETGKTRKKELTAALDAYESDLKARKLSIGTQRKLSALKRQILTFAEERGIATLDEFTTERVREFREGWKDSAISASKKLERLRSFFRFCADNGWILRNPAKSVRPPIASTPPTLPFSAKEIEAILKHADGKWRALALLLMHSGLRIGDAMKLTPAEFDGNKVFLYMQKTRVPVYVPLPEHVIAEVKSLSLTGNHYFWNREGDSQVETATGNARRSFRRICKAAGVKNGHPHRFRDTFAVNLLLKGVPLETVSILLGHASIKITQKHYAPWVRSRQEKLEEEVMKTWQQPKLVRVK